jgi:hypothetical protein
MPLSSKEKTNAYYRQYWKTHPEKYEEHKKRVKESQPRYRHHIKLEVLSHYSGHNPPQCTNPFGEHKEPYTTLDALSIDHINGGGRKENKKVGQWGNNFYRWLRDHNYPEGYQVLCLNCQWIKRARKKETRH